MVYVKIMGKPIFFFWRWFGGKTPYFWKHPYCWNFIGRHDIFGRHLGDFLCGGRGFQMITTKDSNHFGTCDGQKWHETTGGWLNLVAWEAHDPMAGCVIPRWEVPILCKWSWEWRRCILGFIQFEPVISGYWWFIFFPEKILPTYNMWIITKPCFIIFSILKPISLDSLACSHFTR